MKISKFKKILIGTIAATTGLGVAVGVGVSIAPQAKPTLSQGAQDTTSPEKGNSSMTFETIQKDIKEGYSASITKTEESQSKKYVLTIDNNIQKEGVIYLLDSENKETNELEFTPGDTIKIGIKLNEGYEEYTARELKVTGVTPNFYVPSDEVEGETNLFQVKMPKYEDTVDKFTGKSWLYAEGTPITVVPSFIKKSIGTNDNKVDWEHGGLFDSLNGYVYEMKSDMKWSEAKGGIYKTFENDEITNPIDIFIMMNGYKLTLDTPKLEMEVPSGWALHFYNNKNETKDETNGYGEIYVEGKGSSLLEFGGSVTLGSGVKFRMYHSSQGINFINYDNHDWLGDISNDPEVRLGGR